MSHTPEQPLEVPFREVEHDEGDDAGEDWAFRSYPIGTVRDWEWWGGSKEDNLFHKELEQRLEARKRLGGFGFR